MKYEEAPLFSMRRGPVLWLSSVFALTFLAAAPAAAHLELLEPPSRYGREFIKRAPCGMTDGPRAGTPLVLAPGGTLHLRWEEFVDHPGHYRVAFDDDGHDDFVDPATADERFSNATVLLDGIEDRAGGGIYEVDVTLPDVECARCTLQVVQVMTDKPPYGDGNDLYYQCVDLVLERGAADAGVADAGVADAGAVDAGAVDAGSMDAGSMDAGAMIADGAVDAGGTSSGGCALASAPRDGAPGWLLATGAVGLWARRRR